MFEEDRGVVFLADWATNGKLSEVTAAQLGYDFVMSPRSPEPRAARSWLSSMACVSDDVAELLGRAAGPENRVVACGTAISPRPVSPARAPSGFDGSQDPGFDP